MIFADPTELRAGTRLPMIPGLVEAADLESYTGADLIISPLDDLPATTPALIRRHVSAGALLVQRKSGHDLIHSLGETLNGSLVRMRETSAQAGQCVLLFSGGLEHGAGGLAVVDGRDTATPYWAARMALSVWTHRGGVVEQLAGDHEIPEWCRRMELAVKDYSQHPTKALFPRTEYPPDPPDPLDPLQLLVAVRDGRLVLVSFRGIGPAKAEAIWKASGYHLATALELLTDETSPKRLKVPGIDVATIRSIREQCGLQPGEHIGAVTTAVPPAAPAADQPIKSKRQPTQSTLFPTGANNYA